MQKNVIGFSLIEVILAIIIAGILMAFALPRFINIDIATHHASVKATASEFADAVHAISAKHLLLQKPSTTTIEGSTYFFGNGTLVNDWPVGDANLITQDTTTLSGCTFLFNTILNNGPSGTTDTSGDYQVENIDSTCRYTYLNAPDTITADMRIIYDISDGTIITEGVE